MLPGVEMIVCGGDRCVSEMDVLQRREARVTLHASRQVQVSARCVTEWDAPVHLALASPSSGSSTHLGTKTCLPVVSRRFC